MATLTSVMDALKTKGTAQYRKTYARHGMAEARVLGVSSADMKALAKTIEGQQELALQLYATGVMEAMYLAGMVADGALMTKPQLNSWAEGAEGLRMVAENTIAWVASESPFGRELAMKWIASKKEHVAAAGWTTYSGLVTVRADAELNLREIAGLLNKVAAEIAESKDRVKSTMNSFVIAVGSYVVPLREQAKATARQMGAVSVDVGDTACKVPDAVAYIEKIEAAGKAGIKRTTIRC
jgi:3-methyladenine DNA glycosylase AlkD